MKRFTDTLKWQDPWFRKLSGSAKYLWIYMLDHADIIGTFEFDYELAKIDMGIEITQAHFSEIESRIEILGGGRYHIPKFVAFQYGETLSKASPIHAKVFNTLTERGIERHGKEWRYGSETQPPAPQIEFTEIAKPTPKPAKEKKPQPAAEKKPRERNLLMDALAIHAELSSSLDQVTDSKWTSIGVACARILKVMPNVTPEEIERRSKNYLAQFEGASITANALATHWARCERSPKEKPPAKRLDGEVDHPAEAPDIPFAHAELPQTDNIIDDIL